VESFNEYECPLHVVLPLTAVVLPDYRACHSLVKAGSNQRVQISLFLPFFLWFYAANDKTDLNCCRADDLSGSKQLVPVIKAKT
jgi:hypothetical protein